MIITQELIFSLNVITVDDLLKAVKAVTRKSRYYHDDTEARSGIMKTDCSVPAAGFSSGNLKLVEKPVESLFAALNYFAIGIEMFTHVSNSVAVHETA